MNPIRKRLMDPWPFFFSVLEMKITNMTPKKKCDSLLRVQKMSGKNINSYVCQGVFKMLIGLKLTFQRVSSASMSKVKDVHVISGSFCTPGCLLIKAPCFFLGDGRPTGRHDAIGLK